MPEQSTMSVAEILVGDRIRQDIGNLDSLIASIKRVGLLQPVVVRKGGMLIAGRRRLEACKKLGKGTIPVYVVKDLDDAASLLIAERDENTERVAFTATESAKAGKMLEEIERPAAENRMKAGTKQPCDNLPQGKRQPAVREIVGAAVGMSGTTYQRAKAVVDAAECEPEKFGDLPKMMDETNVSRAYTELVERKGKTPNNGEPIEVKGVGVARANEAINCLTRIPKNDALRKRGFQLVTDWIRHNK